MAVSLFWRCSSGQSPYSSRKLFLDNGRNIPVAVRFRQACYAPRRMITGIEIRQHVIQGLASGKLWRLKHDDGTLDDATVGGLCHVCERSIRSGQAYKVAGATITALVHLECYLFWLHASGLFESEPITCASCRRLIPPHAEKTVILGEPYHTRCWERVQDRIER